MSAHSLKLLVQAVPTPVTASIPKIAKFRLVHSGYQEFNLVGANKAKLKCRIIELAKQRKTHLEFFAINHLVATSHLLLTLINFYNAIQSA